jgi:hypothetical protein
VFDSVEIYGLHHARKLRLHALALAFGWDKVHERLGFTQMFYSWFTPAIASSDFILQIDKPLYRALDFLAVCR